MIDLSNVSELITLPQLAKRLPAPGGHCDQSTVFRWAKYGIRGRKLETVKVGGRMLTTWNCYVKFMEELEASKGAKAAAAA